MARAPQKPTEPVAWRRQAREIADSLAIAFILAMVIRHFVLEVFKIPTKSMQPTLLGDPAYGDKILVNKYAYDFRDPDRWDVIVFKYPLDTARNYIKRVVGLPGEAIHIRDGDVFINGQIARKPWPVQKALWRRRSPSGKAESWSPSGGDPSSWELADNEFTANCLNSSQVQYISYNRDILAYEEREFHESGRPFLAMPTSDVMVQFQLVPRAASGSVHVMIEVETTWGLPQAVDQWHVVLPVSEEPAQAQIFRSVEPVAEGEPYALETDRPTLVQVCNVDRTLILRVDDREVARYAYEPSRSITQWTGYEGQAKIHIGCKQAHVVLRRPAIYVDVFYTRHPAEYAVKEPFVLGDDELFVLGDNSANSNDSRYWRTVPRSYLVGEAFLVLWPLGRMKIVR